MINISVILIEPENAGNTGAICRAMKNFDFEELILVGPKFNTDSEDLRNRAKWANDLVDKIDILPKYNEKILKKVRKNFDYLIATTAKLGRDYNILRSPITPEQLAERLSELDKSKKSKKNINIGIVMGREGSGLTNDELKLMDFTVTIPTSKNYGTMNVSHATTIILYEIFKKVSEENIVSHITPISEPEKKQLMKLLDESMDKMRFLNEDKKDTQRIVWKKMINKSFLSKREAYALMGFFKKIKK
ncbi:MAG: RNA methyltransferase [Candidatus Woesearchaeota archaeon]